MQRRALLGEIRLRPNLSGMVGIPLMPKDSWGMRDRRRPEARRISETAAALSLSEFQLFQAAYRHWFAAEPDVKQLEKDFVGYLFHQEIPGYVRHYVDDALARGNAQSAAEDLPRQPPLAGPGFAFGAAMLGLAFIAYIVFFAGS